MNKKQPLVVLSILFAFLLGACATGDKQLKAENRQLEQRLEVNQYQLENARERIASLESVVNKMRGKPEKELKESEVQRVQEAYKSLIASLSDEISRQNVDVKRLETTITVNIPEVVFFDSGKTMIKESGKEVLKKIASALKKLPEKAVRVEGHTDNVPIGADLKDRFQTNWELGALRATNVVRYLVDELGVNADRLSAASFSQYRPVAPNKTEEGRAQNRRIEFVIIDRSAYEIAEKEDFYSPKQ
jgi:chemotaxis protein MotB